MSVPHPVKSGSLLGLTCSVGLGRERGMAGTICVCGEWPLQARAAQICHSLRWVVGLPWGFCPRLWFYWQRQATQAPRNVSTVTCACLTLGSSQNPWDWDCSSLLTSSSVTLTSTGGSQVAHTAPTLGLKTEFVGSPVCSTHTGFVFFFFLYLWVYIPQPQLTPPMALMKVGS